MSTPSSPRHRAGRVAIDSQELAARQAAVRAQSRGPQVQKPKVQNSTTKLNVKTPRSIPLPPTSADVDFRARFAKVKPSGSFSTVAGFLAAVGSDPRDLDRAARYLVNQTNEFLIAAMGRKASKNQRFVISTMLQRFDHHPRLAAANTAERILRDVGFIPPLPPGFHKPRAATVAPIVVPTDVPSDPAADDSNSSTEDPTT